MHCAEEVDAAPRGLSLIPPFVVPPPHSSPPALCECRRCISQSGLLLISHSLIRKGSLSLSLSTPTPPLPCLVGREEGESCSLPEAARSSLNNFSRLPAVLSPVLHHSITPLHKDVQMGWDAHSHMTLTDTLKQARARAHADPHAFCNALAENSAGLPARTRENRRTPARARVDQTEVVVRWPSAFFFFFPDEPFLLPVFFLQEVKSALFLYPSLFSRSLQQLSLVFFLSLCAHRRLMRTQRRLPYLSASVRQKTAQRLTMTHTQHNKKTMTAQAVNNGAFEYSVNPYMHKEKDGRAVSVLQM